MWWDEVYPEFSTRLDNWSGSWALMMPHFSEIPVLQRHAFLQPISDLLLNTFQNRGYFHADVTWRNVGVYLTADGEVIPVLFDLCELEYFNQEKHGNWIEIAISKLRAQIQSIS